MLRQTQWLSTQRWHGLQLACSWLVTTGQDDLQKLELFSIQALYQPRGTPQCRVIMNRGAPGLVMGPCIVEIDGIFIRDVQYQFEVNQCGNEEVNFQGSSANSFQGSSANSVGGDSGQDGRTDRRRR
ncbi:hypothetical protein DPMN_189042 [Dreissena polymorpha]|uniref:Uncharacterized protein n=1 Tax=Dreissena polymorpha TaxID=45954 RepID=A0A9D4IAL8_DREPO|nr:hypothetical protein DPMN_189042 [Dreissena polymorpha]